MSSFLMLDAHLNAIDIILTAIWARAKFPKHKIYLPIVGYSFYVPIMNNVVSYFSRHFDLTLLPVYRKIEENPTNPLMRILVKFYPQKITAQLREDANDTYMKTCINDLKNDNSIVIVSPYGGPIYFGGKIKYGVRKIMENSNNIVLTRSMVKLTPPFYITKHNQYDPKLALEKQFLSIK